MKTDLRLARQECALPKMTDRTVTFVVPIYYHMTFEEFCEENRGVSKSALKKIWMKLIKKMEENNNQIVVDDGEHLSDEYVLDVVHSHIELVTESDDE
jgi:hypothetical protein